MMRIIHNATEFSPKLISLWATSRSLTNCVVPWFISFSSERHLCLSPSSLPKFHSFSPDTFQFIRSLALDLKSADDLERLLSFEPISSLYRHLHSLELLITLNTLDVSQGQKIAQFFRNFDSLDSCNLRFGIDRSEVNVNLELKWREVISLFSNLFTAPYPKSGPKMIRDIVVSFKIALKSFMVLLGTDQSRKLDLVEAIIEFKIVTQLQKLMIVLFESDTQSVNDGRSLGEFLQVFPMLFHIRNKLYGIFPALLDGFLTVDELGPTFDLINTLHSNRDLMKREFKFDKGSVIGACCEFIYFYGQRAREVPVHPDGLTFMQRYGRDLVPGLLETAFSEYRSRLQNDKTTNENQTNENTALFNLHHTVSELIRVVVCFIDIRYWVDGIETAENLKKMVNRDGRGILSHFPLECLDYFLRSDSHLTSNGTILTTLVVAFDGIQRYITRNALLVDAGLDDFPEFVEKYNFPVKFVQLFTRMIQEPETCRIGVERIRYLSSAVYRLIHSGNNFHAFQDRNCKSLIGHNLKGVNDNIVPFVEATIRYVNSAFERSCVKRIGMPLSAIRDSNERASVRASSSSCHNVLKHVLDVICFQINDRQALETLTELQRRVKEADEELDKLEEGYKQNMKDAAEEYERNAGGVRRQRESD